MSWVLLQRGILAGVIGDLAEAERFFREGLALCRLTPLSSPAMRTADCMIRSMLIVVLHYQEKPREMRELLPGPEIGKYNLEPLIYLNRRIVA